MTESRRERRREPRVRRLPVLVLVVALLAVGGLLSAEVSGPTRPMLPAAPASLAALTAPVTSSASSWYCTGGSGPSQPIAQATLVLVNSGNAAVSGTVTAYRPTGHPAKKKVTVPALGQTTVTPGAIASGTWVSSRVDLDGGGVAVSQLVSGPTGWAMSPCATVTSANWYFASGATSAGNSLFVSLFNPTPDDAVVDLTFLTATGPVQPSPFQGLIVAPGGVVTAEVASYVQNAHAVATVVSARAGRIVASELQLHSTGGASGMSLRLGAPSPSPRWYLPSTTDVTGGGSQLVVFNPTAATERVKVGIRLPSGPVDPLTQVVPPHSTWTLSLSGQTRIPVGAAFALSVTSRGGRGVVVDRISAAPSSASAPQWGAVTAIAGSAAASPSGRWTLANPAVAAQAQAGAQPVSVTLYNPGDRAVRASVLSLAAGGGPLPGAQHVRVPPHAVTVVAATGVAAGGKAALQVRADSPLAVTEEVMPVGVAGAVVTAAVPQA